VCRCRSITLEAPPVRSWAVDSLLEAMVAPTLPAIERTERGGRKAAWDKKSAATTQVQAGRANPHL